MTIYFRGGVYYNPGYGTSSAASFNDIKCHGVSLDEPVTVKPWGNEKPKVLFDSFKGIGLAGIGMHICSEFNLNSPNSLRIRSQREFAANSA